MKKLQFARSGYIGISCIFYAAAVIYLLFPSLPPMALSCFSGVILILYGVIKIVGFFSEDLYCLAFRYDMAAETSAHSTDPMSPESVEHLCAKCDHYAEHWKGKADQLWHAECVERPELAGIAARERRYARGEE